MKHSEREFYYMVRPTGDGTQYLVSKWEDSNDQPDTVYTVTTKGKGKGCSCPSGVYRGYCKHTGMVREFAERTRSIRSIA